MFLYPPTTQKSFYVFPDYQINERQNEQNDRTNTREITKIYSKGQTDLVPRRFAPFWLTEAEFHRSLLNFTRSGKLIICRFSVTSSPKTGRDFTNDKEGNTLRAVVGRVSHGGVLWNKNNYLIYLSSHEIMLRAVKTNSSSTAMTPSNFIVLTKKMRCHGLHQDCINLILFKIKTNQVQDIPLFITFLDEPRPSADEILTFYETDHLLILEWFRTTFSNISYIKNRISLKLF